MPATPVTGYLKPWLALALAFTALAALAVACGGEGGGVVRSVLTDAGTVPTATPFSQPPEPVFPEEGAGASTPVSGGEGGGQPGVCGETYIVESGDYPGLIAEKCGVDVNELMQLNGITDPTNLSVGQELKLPPKQE